MTNPFLKITNEYDPIAEHIIDAVAEIGETSVEEILSDSRKAIICRMRATAMMLIRHYTKLSLPQIGSMFGRDHTTVMSAIRQAQMMGAKFEGYEKLCDQIMENANARSN